jgi:hypothetical protein
VSDELVISGSSSSAIATDELYASSQQLARLAAAASVLAMRLASIDRIVSMDWLAAAGAPADAARAEQDIDQAKIVLIEIETQARLLEFALNTAADGYGFVELMIGRFTRGLVGDAAGLFGSLLPLAAPATAMGAGVIALSGADERDASRFFTNPLNVAAVREATMAADDAILGAAGVPRPVARVLGDEGIGLTGVALGAGGLVAAGSVVGAFRETPVRTTSVRSTTVATSPEGFVERIDRIPDPPPTGGPQVVIEKYEQPGQPDRFEVYIAGTVRFDSFETTEPWDMTSNVVNATGASSGSYDSVVHAMKLAGIDQSSPVQFTGYSQGGGTAALLAASGDYNTQGFVSFGGPTGQVELPPGIPTVIVEHSDDIVPALGGSQDNMHAVIVERNVYGGRHIPDDLVMPAHHLFNYRETAQLLDEAQSSQVTSAISDLDRFGAGTTKVTSTAYEFERVTTSSS